MIANQQALLRRELLEHKAIFITPVVVAGLYVLMTLTGQVEVGGHEKVVNLTIVALSNITEEQRSLMWMLGMASIALAFTIVMWIVIVFYSLDALYAERKDKSILFWRSLPVTDAETVISKLLTALLAIPLITAVAAIVTQLLVLVIASVWVKLQGGDAGHLIWAAVPFVDLFAASIIFAFAIPLWLAPFVGWFLFVSGVSKRLPLLLAFLPIFVLPMMEAMMGDTHFTRDAFFLRTVTPDLFDGATLMEILRMADNHDYQQAAESMDLMDTIDLGRFFSSASLWAGFVVCGLFSAAAIYVRRYRDES